MSTTKRCGSTALERTTCMIELILADLKESYRFDGGGGITRIRAVTGMSYAVGLSQEERIDVFTYEFEMRGDLIAIKKETTESY